ncbi:MAG: hypothetical protein NTV33_10990 [Coprothermobacterota bacterium]|nr:hypothetical protein [Coprothermobacterota bacterium]
MEWAADRIFVCREDTLLGSFAIGNLKLHRIMTFSLPTIETCPGALECVDYCYAGRPEIRFLRTKISRHRNLAMTKMPEFPEILDNVISIAKKHGVTIVRPHEAGDFYDIQYVTAWLNVMAAHPDVAFYTYTRSAHFDLSHLPRNFNLLYSLGGKYDHLIPESARRCIVYKENPPKGYDLCPCSPGQNKDICGSGCFLCPSGTSNVAIKRH